MSYCGCDGDDTYRSFSADEQKECRDFLRSHDDVREVENQVTKIMYDENQKDEYFDRLAAGGITLDDIDELSSKVE